MLDFLLQLVWYILPAYAANASPVLLHGKTPLDFGTKFLDGRPLLGKGKTVKGFVFAVMVGSLVGLILGYVEGSIYPRLALAFTISFGAMVGDSLGSFIKRRFNLKRGEAAPFLDQWDFVLSAFLFHYLLQAWLVVPFPSLIEVFAILIMTAFFHVSSNLLAFKLKFKKVPW